MALKEYVGLACLTQVFSLLKSKLDGKENTPTVISYDDFMALTPQQQTSGYYLVVGGTPMTNAYGISYQPNKTVGDALDDHADAISELNADIANRPRYIGNQVLVNDILSSYTATQDCYVTVSGTYTVYVNGVAIAASTEPFVVSLYLKAGQTVASEGANRYRAISLIN